MIRCSNIYCGTTEDITQHHLIPKPYRKGILGRIERMYLCVICHKRVHQLKTNTELAREYYTKEAVLRLLESDVQFRVERVLFIMDYQPYQYMAVA